MSTKPHFSLLATSFAGGPRPRNAALILSGLWLAIFFAALFAPPILDDADATHAQAARAMATTGDLVTLRVDGVRYLEKAPLPYWLAAASFRIFGFNTFAAHLPQALAVLLLALLGHRWANQAFGARTAFYTAIALLTSLGTFLFTRILIPEALLSLFLAAALFAFLKSLGPISSPPLVEQIRVPHASIVETQIDQQPRTQLVQGLIFASPQQGSVSLEEALRNATGPSMERFIQVARDIETQHNILMQHQPATGVWKGGAEPSLISNANSFIDLQLLYAIAAIRGKLANQDAVLSWHNDDDGPHLRYVVDLKSVESPQTAQRILASGIQYATIAKTDTGTEIHIILLDTGEQAKEELEGKLYEHFSDGDIHEQPGYARFLWREAHHQNQSQWTFDQVIQDYERRSRDPSPERRSQVDDLSEDHARPQDHLESLPQATQENQLLHLSQSHRDARVKPPPPERPALIPSATPLYPYLMWASLALAVLTKGLVALVFFFATTLLYLLLLGEFKQSLPKLKPLSGAALFLVIAAPWHILAALRNPGFLRFYFWNEHVLRFLGRRVPADFNRLPGYLYWTLHLVWLFPWSLFLPLGLAALYRRMRHQTITLTHHIPKDYSWRGAALVVAFLAFIGIVGLAFQKDVLGALIVEFTIFIFGMVVSRRFRAHLTPSPFHRIDPQQRTILLLSLFAAFVLLFFSLSTNQEYYTFPVYLPLLLLIAATVTRAEQTYSSSPEARRWLTFTHASLAVLGFLAALTLLYGLWASRHISYTPDIGTLLQRRNVAANTLSLSHLFDLTTASFAALRLPAALAALTLLLGPHLAWLLRTQRRHIAATTTIAFTTAVFLVAAHLAFARFAPMLSSESFAAQIQQLEATHAIPPRTPVLIFGDQAYGSSLPFYLGYQVQLVDGRTTSLLYGSTYPDAPPIFLTSAQLAATWPQPTLKLLFVPAERRDEAFHLLQPNLTILRDESGKLLITNHPLMPHPNP